MILKGLKPSGPFNTGHWVSLFDDTRISREHNYLQFRHIYLHGGSERINRRAQEAKKCNFVHSLFTWDKQMSKHTPMYASLPTTLSDFIRWNPDVGVLRGGRGAHLPPSWFKIFGKRAEKKGKSLQTFWVHPPPPWKIPENTSASGPPTYSGFEYINLWKWSKTIFYKQNALLPILTNKYITNTDQ